VSVALDKETAAGESGATGPAKKGLLSRSTALRHLLLVLAAFIGIILLLEVLGPFRDSQLTSMAYYVPAVAGLTVLTGINGQISLGHGALMAVGAYTTAVLLERQEGLPYLLIAVLSVITTCLVGLLVGAAAARLHGPYLAGATLALAVGLPGLAIRYEELLGGEQGLQVSPPRTPDWFRQIMVDITGTRPTGITYLAYLCWALALLSLWLLSNLITSKYGRQWRAVRDDEVAAQLTGIDLGRSRILAFVVSSACAGLAGSMLAIVTRLAAPTSFTVVLSLALLTAMVIGGLGSLTGAVIGSALLVFLQPTITDLGLDAGLDSSKAANIAPLVYGVLLVLVILLAPRGLVGSVRQALLGRRQTKSLSSGS
jgi:branched-chain amino acid transport system permease protein